MMTSGTLPSIRRRRPAKKTEKSMAFEPAFGPGPEKKESDTASAVTNGWSFCEPDGKKPKVVCERQADHVLWGGRKECLICRDFIRQVSHNSLWRKIRC